MRWGSRRKQRRKRRHLRGRRRIRWRRHHWEEEDQEKDVGAEDFERMKEQVWG